MPPNYQGLLFWLDGGGDYMAWAARNNGNYNMNPLIKFSWYRKEWTPFKKFLIIDNSPFFIVTVFIIDLS